MKLLRDVKLRYALHAVRVTINLKTESNATSRLKGDVIGRAIMRSLGQKFENRKKIRSRIVSAIGATLSC